MATTKGTDLRRAVANMNMRLERYLAVVILPAVGAGLLLGLAGTWYLAPLLPAAIWWMPLTLPLVALLLALAYPLQVAAKRGRVMDYNMHYFISHLGVLATSRVPPVELFRMLGEKEKEYGPLAEECKKIATLVQRWNMSLAEACRFTARQTASLLFSDFLERLAFGLESGTDLEAYLTAEQEVVMADYETVYKGVLKNIEDIKALFNGAMMTVIFMVMFAMMMAILLDTSATTILTFVIFITLAIEGAFLLLITSKVPPDPIWTETGIGSPLWERTKLALPLAILATLTLLPLLLFTTDLPFALSFPVALTPLIVPGYLAGKAEDMVKRRDDNYPAFMRSLGSSTAARGGDARGVLRFLRHHDFGPLTTNIRDLFARLQLRVDDDAAWQYFTTEAGSRLMERYTRMYEEAIETGGRPDAIGKIISDNMVRIIGLRKLRYQQASTFRGMLFGIAAGVAFSLFIGIAILSMLSGLFESVGSIADAPVAIPSLIHIDAIDVPTMQLLSIMILIVNAGMSSVMIRLVDGGAPLRALQDFTLLVWVSNVTALASMKLMSGMIGAGVNV